MAEQSAQQEPSMEEILASIRRIISEDGEEEAAGEQAAAPSGPTAVEDAPAPAEEPEEESVEALEAVPEQEEAVAEEPEPEEAAEAVTEEAEAAIEEPEPQAASASEDNVATAEDVADIFGAPDEAPAVQEDDGDDVLELTDVVPETAEGEPIVSHMTEAATSEHLRALSGLMVRSYPGSENTLEGLVREMLKPMLREWLDANLPTLVEQLVNREIARIAGREK